MTQWHCLETTKLAWGFSLLSASGDVQSWISRMAAAAPAPRLITNISHGTGSRFVSCHLSVTPEQALAHCLSSSTLLFFRPPALSSGWGIMRSSASLPYTPRGAMCKNVCHLRWRQGSDRRAKQHNCSVGSVHVTDCSRAKHASSHMYVGIMHCLEPSWGAGGWRPRRPPFSLQTSE